MNLQIGKFLNIPLYLNLYTIPFALLMCMGTEHRSLSLAIFVISMFFIVLHEYGHCLMARRYGWKVLDITILPIGGVAQIFFKHIKPKQEIYVALAGPAVSFLLSIVFFILTLLSIYLQQYPLMFLFMVCAFSNLIIVLFNLLCVFPMDGGRVLRAVLSLSIGHERATLYAVRIGQIGGIILAVVCFYFGLWIAGFIFVLMSVLSQNELTQARLISTLYALRINLAKTLNNPALIEADLPELIHAIQSIQDDSLKQKVEESKVLELLIDLDSCGVNI